MADQNITSLTFSCNSQGLLLTQNQNSFIGPTNGDICVSQQPKDSSV